MATTQSNQGTVGTQKPFFRASDAQNKNEMLNSSQSKWKPEGRWSKIRQENEIRTPPGLNNPQKSIIKRTDSQDSRAAEKAQIPEEMKRPTIPPLQLQNPKDALNTNQYWKGSFQGPTEIGKKNSNDDWY